MPCDFDSLLFLMRAARKQQKREDRERGPLPARGVVAMVTRMHVLIHWLIVNVYLRSAYQHLSMVSSCQYNRADAYVGHGAQEDEWMCRALSRELDLGSVLGFTFFKNRRVTNR